MKQKQGQIIKMKKKTKKKEENTHKQKCQQCVKLSNIGMLEIKK